MYKYITLLAAFLCSIPVGIVLVVLFSGLLFRILFPSLQQEGLGLLGPLLMGMVIVPVVITIPLYKIIKNYNRRISLSLYIFSFICWVFLVGTMGGFLGPVILLWIAIVFIAQYMLQYPTKRRKK